MRKAIPAYVDYKYQADKDLVLRTAFKWSILRPGGLSNDPGTGKASVGRTHLRPTISVCFFSSLDILHFVDDLLQRDDVALTLALLAERPDAAGLAIDLVGGEDNIEGALDEFIKKGETDWLG